MGTVQPDSELIPKRGRKKLPDDEVSAATRKMRMLRSLACGNKYEKLAREQEEEWEILTSAWRSMHSARTA